jgi:hypothetical protein
MDRKFGQRSEENIWVELEKAPAVGDSLNARTTLRDFTFMVPCIINDNIE